jgi:ribonuclease P protein component
MSQFGFTQRMRIRRAADFERVYETGSTSQDFLMKTVVAPNGLLHPRLGLSVGRRYGNAVRRNRFKRLTREAFRLGFPQLSVLGGVDIVVIPGRLASELTRQAVSDSLLKLVPEAAGKPRTPRRTARK